MIYRDEVNIELVILSIYIPAPFKAGIWRITLRGRGGGDGGGGGNTLNLDIIPLIFSSAVCHLFFHYILISLRIINMTGSCGTLFI